jgi:hypothetical protein
MLVVIQFQPPNNQHGVTPRTAESSIKFTVRMWNLTVMLLVTGRLLVGQHAGNGHAAAFQPPTRPPQIGQPRYRPSEYESGRPHCMSPLAPLCQPACQAPHFLQVTQATVFHSRQVTKSQVVYNVTPCRMVNMLPMFRRIVMPSSFTAI